MAWNQPGNNGNHPWGNNRKNEQGPPDLDKIFKQMTKGFNTNSFSSGGMILVFIILLVIWVLSGFYKVNEAEQAVVLRLGKFNRIEYSGLNWKPSLIDKVYIVDVNKVSHLPIEGVMLTQDENVVVVKMEVQFKISDSRAYLFSVVKPEESLNQAVDSALRFVIGHSTMESVLTNGRKTVRNNTRSELENIIKSYNMGLEIVDIAFKEARPPEAVKPAFDDAIAAQEDEERYVQEATAYKLQVLPQAGGKAQRLLEEAMAYKEKVIFRAEGEVARFNKLLPEYLEAPNVTKQRLYLETMEAMYRNTSKILIDNNGEGNAMFYLPLDQLIKNNKIKEEQAVSKVNAIKDYNNIEQHHYEDLNKNANTNYSSSNHRYNDGRSYREGRN